MLKKLLIIPAIVLMSQGVFADDHGAAPRPNYQEPQQEDYQEPYYGNGCGTCGPQYAPPPCGSCYVQPPPVIVNPCGGCYVPPPPPPPPPVVIYNPGVNYVCGYAPCAQPYPPYGPPPRYWGPRPTPYGYGGRPIIAPRPLYRHMSAAGCEVQQGNNGEFSVISADGDTLYTSKIEHAQENAEYMKAFYEKTSALCGGVRSGAKSLDI